MLNETKAEKFKRLAEGRTEQILDGIRKLANLANDRAYVYTEEQVNRIFRAIDEHLDLARSRFQAQVKFGRERNESFKL